MNYDNVDIRQIEPTKEQYKAAMHELLGFLAGSNLDDDLKERALKLPMVAMCQKPMWLIPNSKTLVSDPS